MTFHPITRFPIVEATDFYFNEVHSKWFPVPQFWVGQYASNFTHRINHGRP